MHDPNGHTEELAVGGGVQSMITEAAVCRAYPLDARLGVGASLIFRPGEGGVAQRLQGSARNSSSSWGMIVSVMGRTARHARAPEGREESADNKQMLGPERCMLSAIARYSALSQRVVRASRVFVVTVAVRVIPCLDVHGGRVVKGVNFVALRDAGDPVELAAHYDAEGADELTFLDISASAEGREPTLDVVRRTAETVFIPLTVGGGITSVEDVDILLRAGADKVAINTGAIRKPEVIGRSLAGSATRCWSFRWTPAALTGLRPASR